jgi:hypothetical protein
MKAARPGLVVRLTHAIPARVRFATHVRGYIVYPRGADCHDVAVDQGALGVTCRIMTDGPRILLPDTRTHVVLTDELTPPDWAETYLSDGLQILLPGLLWKYVELVAGIDLVNWEQVDPQPTGRCRQAAEACVMAGEFSAAVKILVDAYLEGRA